ncbi:MAG TPA: nucleoside triphosphate pyrophosphohydrolase, partial [Marinobacter adhaerens]|nr:nucleoside triphosphate pyrophosphohydrolase [Marinobacter adhaerens]
QCLRSTNAKFERRFRYVERALADAERPLNESSLDEMEGHWQAAKAQEQR